MSLIVLFPLFAGFFQLLAYTIAPFGLFKYSQAIMLIGYGCVWGTAGDVLWKLLTQGFIDQTITVYRIYTWATLGGVELGLNLCLDYIAIIMSFTVLTVSICVQCYSLYYMKTDPHLDRFMVYLSWFTFCMLLLVSAEDLLQFFIGWEAVGLCSYVLISFWYTRLPAIKAAAKAVYVNRIGDFTFFVAISFLFIDFGTLNIYEISFMSMFFKPYYVTLIPTIPGLGTLCYTNIEIICFNLFLAVMSKSAQFGLHMWLPDAMEGPTPVSALIHAATMVTAGVYLMVRLAALFLLAPRVLHFATYIGSLTMIFGATTALYQSDVKKIIAFSTCSQLGYMVVACGLSHFSVAFFHLTTHAFFKALLFLCAGVIIHSLDGEQDLRRMGALRNQLPLVYVTFSIASAALMGIPFFSGYYSKDLIIGLAWFTKSMIGNFAGEMAIHAAWFTSLYSIKLLIYTFLTPLRTNARAAARVHVAASYWYGLPLIVLAVFSVISGWVLKDALAGPGVPLFPSPVASLVTRLPNTLLRVEWAPASFKLLTMSGAVLALLVYVFYVRSRVFFAYVPAFDNWLRCWYFFFHRWLFDLVVAHAVRDVFKGLYKLLFLVQQQFIDIISAHAIVQGVERTSAVVVDTNPRTISYYLQGYFLGFVILCIFACVIFF